MKKEKIFTMKYSTIYHISSKTVCVLIVFNIFLLCTRIKVILQQIEFVSPNPDYMIPIDCCQ